MISFFTTTYFSFPCFLILKWYLHRFSLPPASLPSLPDTYFGKILKNNIPKVLYFTYSNFIVVFFILKGKERWKDLLGSLACFYTIKLYRRTLCFRGFQKSLVLTRGTLTDYSWTYHICFLMIHWDFLHFLLWSFLIFCGPVHSPYLYCKGTIASSSTRA